MQTPSSAYLHTPASSSSSCVSTPAPALSICDSKILKQLPSSRLRLATFRLVPYHSRSRSTISVTRLLDLDDLEALNSADEDYEDADEDT